MKKQAEEVALKQVRPARDGFRGGAVMGFGGGAVTRFGGGPGRGDGDGGGGRGVVAGARG